MDETEKTLGARRARAAARRSIWITLNARKDSASLQAPTDLRVEFDARPVERFRLGVVEPRRVPPVLALRVAPREPTAQFAVRLVREAARAFGAPAHLVTDHGKQLTALAFRQAVRSLGVRPRYGAVHRHGSLAVVERWWKSMKVEYANGLHLFRPLRAIEAKLRGYVRWFNEERPHQGLGQRTPDEVHFGRATAARAVPLCAELVAENIDGDHDLPVLRLRRAA